MLIDRSFECTGCWLKVSRRMEHDAPSPKCSGCQVVMVELFPAMSYADACEIHEQRQQERSR